ncbi:MAG: hypothetical protein ACUVUC_06510 [Thermoguttaceae bacterium]
MPRAWILAIFCCAAAFLCPATASNGPDSSQIVLETDYVRYTIGGDGKNVGFVDKRTGKDYLAPAGKQALLRLSRGGVHQTPSACRYADGKLLVRFIEPEATVILRVASERAYFVFEIESVSDPAVEELSLGNLVIPAADRASGMSGVAADADWAVALRALNLQMLGVVGGRPAWLAAVGYRKYGLTGGKVGLAGCPASAVRDVLKQMLQAERATWSPLGGPWALDAPENRGSYVFATVSENNVDDWIALARKAGLAQIHLIGWEQTLGHYEPRKDLFPHGLAGLKSVVDKIHAAGLKAGMHILTGCISPSDPWVSPLPDPRLAKDATFQLAGAVDEKATVLQTVEKPGDLDTIWAYGSRGNVLQIGEELIQYTGLSQEPPFGFTGCRRGAFGTRPAPHETGNAVHHLFVRYTSFLPDQNSTLVEELAERIAGVFNTCGFDMIYQDGAEGMPGGWRGVARMREAIFRKIRRPVLVEASSWGYHEWAFHSRIGAWDHPNWGLKRFVDVHCRANQQYRMAALLPAQLGWWVILGPTRDHPAETPDEFEYLCAKALAYDFPSSFQGVSVGPNPPHARQDNYLALLGRYERLRLSGRCPPSIKERLKQPQQDFRLVEAADGSWEFLPTDYAVHKITGLEDGSQRWVVHNRFVPQPVRLRIEALYAAEPYDQAQGPVLAAFTAPGEFATDKAAPGVRHQMTLSAEPRKAGQASGRYWAANEKDSRQGAWCLAARRFTPPVDLENYDALGLWIHGDGKGQLLNFQLTNPQQFWDTFDEHYVKVDFRGWRYFELHLRERDADQYADYTWPYAGDYAVYRSPLIRSHTSALNLYYNNLPPNDSVTCYLSPIKALRATKIILANPSVSIGGQRIAFPVALQSGSYLEFDPAAGGKLFDERGALVRELAMPAGAAPILAAGDNQLQFACQPPAGHSVRARVTLISSGQPVGRIPASEVPRP